MLAYLFWHQARPGIERDEYERALSAFHAALARSPSASFRLARAPWGEAGDWYEDWYPAGEWAGLGELNEHAVTGARRAPHDAAAALAGEGKGGVMRHLGGGLELRDATAAHWLHKPAGLGYEDFHELLLGALPPRAAAWQRQMVLGPAPEYAVLAAEAVDLPWRARATGPARIA